MAHREGMGSLFNNDKFANMYKTAEQFTGHFAGELIERANFKDDLKKLDKVVILDNACGTGIVSVKILGLTDDKTADNIDLTCADYAEAMLGIVKPRIEAGPIKKFKAVKADAMDTKLPSSHFTHIFFSFGPMLMPNPIQSIKECYRMLAPGGLLGINTWERIGWYEDFRDALAKHSEFPSLPEQDKFVQGFAKTKERWDRAHYVQEHLEANGFVDVKAEGVPTETTVQVDDIIGLLGQVMTIVYATYWSEEQKNDTALKEKAVDVVGKHLKEKYGSEPMVWSWIAVVATGRKPA